MKQIKITSKDGVTLHTANKFVDDDLSITIDESLLGVAVDGTLIFEGTTDDKTEVVVPIHKNYYYGAFVGNAVREE